MALLSSHGFYHMAQYLPPSCQVPSKGEGRGSAGRFPEGHASLHTCAQLTAALIACGYRGVLNFLVHAHNLPESRLSALVVTFFLSSPP